MISISNIKDSYNIYPKAWGCEIMIHNGSSYCGKILRFNSGAKFSMHFHSKKMETWYVSKGHLVLTWIDTDDAEKNVVELKEGDIVDIERNTPHQLFAVVESEIFEVSTEHSDNDSYRVEKGDSQLWQH